MNTDNNEFEWNQFCKLGEMIGDGLHYEEPWIAKEYKRLGKILMPEAYAEQRKAKSKSINDAVKKRLLKDKCSKCSSELKQVRAGSYIVKCVQCGARFKYRKK